MQIFQKYNSQLKISRISGSGTNNKKTKNNDEDGNKFKTPMKDNKTANMENAF